MQKPDKIADVDIVIAESIGRDRAYILVHPEYRPTLWQYCKIIRALRRLDQGWPIAYITGKKEFFSLTFAINKHVLIPRSETELLVEEGVKKINNFTAKNNGILLVDVGTGSGCIPISIAKNVAASLDIFSIDISRLALRAARKNAGRHNVDIRFFRGFLLSPLIKRWKKLIETKKLMIITANLPYLTNEQFADEPSIKHEPKTALVADAKNGLTLYEKLFTQIIALPKNKADLLLLCEIDPRQSSAASDLAKKYFLNARIEIKKDLAGHDRLVLIEMKY